MFTVKRRIKKDTDAYNSIRVYISSLEIWDVYIRFYGTFHFNAFIAKISNILRIKLSQRS